MNFGIVLGIVLISFGFYGIGYNKGQYDHQELAVEQGYGYYDPTTREFKFGRIK